MLMHPDTACPVQSLHQFCICITLHHAVKLPPFFQKEERWFEEKKRLTSGGASIKKSLEKNREMETIGEQTREKLQKSYESIEITD